MLMQSCDIFLEFLKPGERPYQADDETERTSSWLKIRIVVQEHA